jgi:hypothetical protein
MPEKSGMDTVPWLDSCATEDEISAAVVAMMTIRMVDFSNQVCVARWRASRDFPKVNPDGFQSGSPVVGTNAAVKLQDLEYIPLAAHD